MLKDALLAQLEATADDHLIWLTTVQTALFFPEHPRSGDVVHDPGHLCTFGVWYEKNKLRPLVNQPAMEKLARCHREMHVHASRLLLDRRNGQPPSAEESETLMAMTSKFLSQARRLERAFASAAANLDPLTGLHNRQSMTIELETERQRHIRTQKPCALVIADIDHFKQVNDNYGHAAGDTILESTSQVFQDGLRPFDHVFRFGGEEFLFCLPDTDTETAANITDRLREILSKSAFTLPDGRDIHVTASFGIASMDGEAEISNIEKQADHALYQAKNDGRNCVRVWHGDTSTATD